MAGRDERIVKILMTEFVTHDVKRFIVEKPARYKYIPGQANLVSIDKPKWRENKHPFTFTSLNEALVLEFTIKRYPQHHGVTDQLHMLKPGDKIILRKPFGTINFKGRGIFIAGGAGITPFIAIFRQLKKEDKIKGNRLIFSNKTEDDIILHQELKEIFREDPPIFILTREEKEGYEHGHIDEKFLKEKIGDFSQNFYVCGPPRFVRDIVDYLKNLGAAVESIVIEE